MTIEPDANRWNHGGPPDPDPCDLLHVTGELFPFAADEEGIWMVAGVWPWTTLPIHGTSDPVTECRWELADHVEFDALIGPHQSSSRPDGPVFVTTHFAILDVAGPVPRTWPQAKPVSLRMSRAVGKPPTHPANAAPVEIRMIDALMHSLRHVAFQLSEWGDAEIASKLDRNWRRHMIDWKPELYKMYDRLHESA